MEKDLFSLPAGIKERLALPIKLISCKSNTPPFPACRKEASHTAL
jgi:hypothetical protein